MRKVIGYMLLIVLVSGSTLSVAFIKNGVNLESFLVWLAAVICTAIMAGLLRLALWLIDGK